LNKLGNTIFSIFWNLSASFVIANFGRDHKPFKFQMNSLYTNLVILSKFKYIQIFINKIYIFISKNNMTKISTNPPTGTYDRYPEEFMIRDYIFQTWKNICIKFWYQQYLGPIVENVQIRKAKSGEDVGGSELTILTDRDWNISEIALRPEMTPTVTRMISKIYTKIPKPVRYFSIANFYRNEKPQRWRNREFWQLNVDLFGDRSINSDIEILSMTCELMKAFNPPANSWKISINHRKLIDFILTNMDISDNTKAELIRLMDKWQKLDNNKINENLIKLGLSMEQISKIQTYMNTKKLSDLVLVFDDIEQNIGFQDLIKIFDMMKKFWNENIEFDATVIRWFDYYDGFVFEIQDLKPENNRALFGWWRYNGLGQIFGIADLPAVWFAPWDESMRLFLESWNMIDDIKKNSKYDIFYVPILDKKLEIDYRMISAKLRNQWKCVISWLEEEKIWKAIEKASKLWCKYCIIFAEDEKSSEKFICKNLENWEQKLEELV